MKTGINTKLLEQALIDSGIVPPNCRNMEIRIEANSLIKIRFEIFVDADVLGTIGAIFVDAADAQAADDERNRKATA